MKKTITIIKEVILCDDCGKEIIEIAEGKTYKCMITGKELCYSCARFITLVLCKKEDEKIRKKVNVKDCDEDKE